MKKVWITTGLFFVIIFFAWFLVIQLGQKHISHNRIQEKISSPIQPGSTHKQYWSMNGENIMLLGGSIEDNLFQYKNFEEQLILLKSIGGNYVRNTMSSRDEGDVWAFAKNEVGLFNLNKWNDEYWRRFNDFLKACSDRELLCVP